MAKKTKKVEVEPQIETMEEVVAEFIEDTVVTKPKKNKVVEKPLPRNEWEIKDRVYYLKSKRKPLTYMLKSSNVYYFDKDLGYERELKYCQNQRTPFVDEMKGDQRLEHIIFRNGTLFVEKEKTILQKFLSLYHPHKNNIFYEHKPQAVAADQVEIIEMEIEALNAAQSIDIDMAEAVMRVEVGSKVNEMSSKELKRDLLLYAKRNPSLFLELVNDENVVLRKLW